MKKGTFVIEKTPFEQTVYFEKGIQRVEVCRISQYSNSLEVYTKFKGNNAGKATLLEIDFKKNRDTELTSHFVAGDIETLCFKYFEGLGDLKVGQTPAKIKRFFSDHNSSYLEAYGKCKNHGRQIYFSIRFMEEATVDEFDKEIIEENFLIGAYLYDPKSINDEVYQPLQAIYAAKVTCDI